MRTFITKSFLVVMHLSSGLQHICCIRAILLNVKLVCASSCLKVVLSWSVHEESIITGFCTLFSDMVGDELSVESRDSGPLMTGLQHAPASSQRWICWHLHSWKSYVQARETNKLFCYRTAIWMTKQFIGVVLQSFSWLLWIQTTQQGSY